MHGGGVKNKNNKAATEKCSLRYGVRFNRSLRTVYCCRERHGFMIKHWKCVGFGEEDCPLSLPRRPA